MPLWLAMLPALATPAAASAAPSPESGVALSRLDAVQVTTRRPEDRRVRAEAIAGLDDAALERLAPTHANEALARVPGAWASRGSGQEQLLALRSPVLTGPGACGAFLVLDDGVPIRPAGFCNVNQLSELNLAQAAGVEVLRGPGGAVHGSNALHGVVAVQPRLPGDGGGARVEFGSDDYRRALLSLDGGGRLRLDATLVDADSFRADEGYRQQQANLQWQPAPGADTRLAFAAHRLRQETAGFAFGEGAWRDARRFGNANPEAFREADSARLVLHHVRAAGDGEWLLRPYARDESQRFLQHFNLGQPLEENGSRILGVQAMWSDESLRIGLDVEGVEGELRQTQARALTTGTPAQNAQRPAGTHYDYAIDARQVALFGEKQWRFDRDAITFGARIENLRYRHDNRAANGNLRDDGTPCGFGGCLYLRPADRRDAFTARSAQLGWMRSLDGGWSVGARAARAFRFPQATELYRLQRGQTVEGIGVETADSLESVLRLNGPTLRAEAVAYAMRKRDVLLRDAAGLSVAGAATRHRGVELAGTWTPDDATWLEGQLAWSDQRYAFDRLLPGGETIRRGARIDTAPEWLGGLRVGRRFGTRFEAELEGVWQGAYAIDAANTRRYGGHVLWHARLGAGLNDDWRATFRVMNLADRRYAERVDFAFGEERSFPGAGRSVFVGLERRFE
ncbi:TonB-dependent receptor [Silanimonas sp.]|jgi:outer membrane receptor protein involved in Fe transport|uniref:TonB-dependent receptor n=1 Tax=Silanimonas sp. TaxID=1929290 RepID=UPI0037CBAF85